MDPSLTSFAEQACVGVVLATQEYPVHSTPLRGLSADVSLGLRVQAFWGGSTLRDGVVDASGGRVITVTALGETLADAQARAYEGVHNLAARFDRAGSALTYRTDIARLG